MPYWAVAYFCVIFTKPQNRAEPSARAQRGTKSIIFGNTYFKSSNEKLGAIDNVHVALTRKITWMKS